MKKLFILMIVFAIAVPSVWGETPEEEKQSIEEAKRQQKISQKAYEEESIRTRGINPQTAHQNAYVKKTRRLATEQERQQENQQQSQEKWVEPERVYAENNQQQVSNQQAWKGLYRQMHNEYLKRQPKQVQIQAQRQELQDDYDAGKISSDKYYEALARIDQTDIQQQQVDIQRRQANKPVILNSGKSRRTVYDRSGNIIGYVN